MNKILFQAPNADIYAFVAGSGWQVIGNGEPTDLMFIQKGSTSIVIADFSNLFTLIGSNNIDVLVSKQADAVITEIPITETHALDNGEAYKSLDVDLTQYVNVTSISIKEG